LDTLPVFLQVLVADAGVLDPVAEEPLEVVAARYGDDRLAALVTPQQSAARELGDRLADDGAADVERLRELRGRRERVAGMQAALADQPRDQVRNLVGEGLAVDLVPGGRHAQASLRLSCLSYKACRAKADRFRADLKTGLPAHRGSARRPSRRALGKAVIRRRPATVQRAESVDTYEPSRRCRSPRTAPPT